MFAAINPLAPAVSTYTGGFPAAAPPIYCSPVPHQRDPGMPGFYCSTVSRSVPVGRSGDAEIIRGAGR